ncbi:MAG: DUF3806 domain-containing protein [Planctomycetota bacterium]
MPERTLFIGGGAACLQVPAATRAEVEPDGTTALYPSQGAGVVLRFSVLSARRKAATPPIADYLRAQAQQRGWDLSVRGDRTVASYREPSADDGRPGEVRCWQVGQDASPEVSCLTYISATIAAGAAEAPEVAALLAAVPRMIETLEPTTRTEELPTRTGVVQLQTTVVEPAPQELRDLGDEERAWLAHQLAAARALIARYCEPEPEDPFDPACLDRAFGAWLLADPERSEEGELVAAALGAAFGERCVRALGMRWVVLTDELGTDLAVHHDSGAATAFPVESVRKRLASGAGDFFEPIYLGIRERIADAQAEG